MTTAVKSGRQRSQAADDAILTATLDVLRQHGYQALTISAVIERSGVSSATLYRRWPDKQALVVAALRTLTADLTCSDTGTLAGDVESLVKRMARAMATPDDLFAVLATEVKHNDELRAMNRVAFIEPRLGQVKAILDRAVARGELVDRPADDVALSLITGPLYHRAFVLGEKLTPSFQRTVVHHVLAGLGQ
ncbi:MAG: TetR family transcriptional regulator [Actinomycetia bacterium]|nr:TetR family transcriptional regulator [Actinomycetes bacterium]